MHYVIVGNGVAGTSAAAAIRKTDTEGDITIFTDEARPFYSRLRLIDYLAGEVGEEELIVHKEHWYGENRIRLRLAAPVAAVDAGRREVVLQGGERLGYDRLLMATGSEPFVPPIAGTHRKGVFTLRTVEDARAIRDYAEGVEEVLLIGGGVLGLETGNALRKRGKNVSVVEVFPRLLPRQMDEEGSEILCDQMKGMGFRFYLGTRAREILGDGKVEGALLEDGQRVAAGMVVISSGIKPYTELARSAGAQVGPRGVVVDDRMRTTVDGVYAAGDAAEHKGVLYGLWPAAERQGQVAGANMAGGAAVFEGFTPSSVLKVAGIDLVSAGKIEADGACQCIIERDRENHIYRKVVVENDCLCGCILLGPIEGRRKLLKAIEEKRPLREIEAELRQWNLKAL